MRSRHAAILSVVASLLLAMYVVRDDIEVNGDSRLAMVYAVVDRRTLAVEDYVGKAPAVIGDLAEHDGHLYTAKPPLPALLVTPVYAALRIVLPPADLQNWWWRWALTLVGAGIPFALLSLAVGAVAASVDARAERRRPLRACALVVASPLVVYATVFFSHVLAALLLLALLLVTVGERRRPLLSGLLTGALVSTELLPATAALVPFLYGRVRAFRAGIRPGSGSAVVSGIGLAIGVSPILLYQWAAFGSPFANMYASIADPAARAAYAAGGLQAPRPDVALYVLGSPQQGLLVFAPIVLIGTLALIARWRAGGRDRHASGLSLGTFGAGVIVLASFTLWYDGSQYGPRYLVPFIPLLVWPLATWRASRIALVATPLALPHLAALTIDEPMLAPQASTYAEVAARYVAGRLDPNLAGIALRGLGIRDGDVIGASALVVVVLAIVAAPLFRRRAAQ